MHQCADVIGLDDEPAPRGSRAALAILLGCAALVVGVFTWWGLAAARHTGAAQWWVAVVIPVAVVLVMVWLIYRRLRPLGGARLVLSGMRATGGPARYAASLCPHGIGLRFPGRDGQLVGWAQVRDIGVFPAGSGRAQDGPAIVAARLVPGADLIGMPPVGRLVPGSAVSGDPDWVWLGRVPADRADALSATVADWRAGVAG